MAKQTGLGSSLLIAQYDLSGDTQMLGTTDAIRGTIDVTSIQDLAPSRLLGRKDGRLSFVTFWNTVAGQANPVLRAMPTTDTLATWAVGVAVGDAAASLQAKETSYAPTFGADGSLIATVTAEANGFPLEWGQLLTTGKQTFASGTVNGTSIDLGATSTLFGAAGYLHAISLGSGTPTVTIADSADNSSFSPITGMAFTAISAPTSERVQGTASATVRRYVRVQVTGSYTNLVAVVNFVRYISSPNT